MSISFCNWSNVIKLPSLLFTINAVSSAVNLTPISSFVTEIRYPLFPFSIDSIFPLIVMYWLSNVIASLSPVSCCADISNGCFASSANTVREPNTLKASIAANILFFIIILPPKK